MEIQYLIINSESNLILGTTLRPDPDAGPVIPHLDASPIEGAFLVKYDGEFTRAGRLDTEGAWWVDGAIAWAERRDMAAVQLEAQITIDAAADAARLSVSPAGRDLEYRRAEDHARAYRAAGFAGDVPPSVASWSKAKQWTPQAAAIDIIETADRWYAALDGIRDLRLNAKERALRATSSADVGAIVTQFLDDLSNLMKGVQ